MTMTLLLGIMLIFGALFLVFAALAAFSPESRGVSRSIEVLEAMTSAPEEMTKELDPPFSERVLAPLALRFQSIGRRITGADQAERIRQRLDRAGNPAGWTVDRVASTKVLGLVAGFGLSTLVAIGGDLSLPVRILIVVLGTAVGFQAPNIYLYNVASKRNALMLKELADALDLLTISVEAGLGFDAAVQQVARNTEGPLSMEFGRVLQEMQIGRGRADALRGLGQRTTLGDVKSFVGAMVQADSFGIPIGQVLRVQSQEIRMKRRQRAEEKAGQIPVKIMVPVILFILPCLLLVVMGPAVISVTQNF
ncbi:type II secretion system F family protein [Nocardioides donggukensis]|uniref:Type II secretion system F family protein n=1 Tax=Nocardioides donggukensis TaxID=2774019 RepID=A0A927K382_9ACTN|nr:type II secretion system F family protein [Nocardioides donggukensis]MBD8869152.1 type II secretion system F family protein [Nocardioides donggukensis]